MWSSSSADREVPIGKRLARALANLRSDHPEGFNAVVADGDGLDVTLDVRRADRPSPGDVARVRFRSGTAEIDHVPTGTGTVEIATDADTVGAVLAGRASLADVVVDDRVRIVGPLDDVVRCLDTLTTFVRTSALSAGQQRLALADHRSLE